jgi:hypothetical protein
MSFDSFGSAQLMPGDRDTRKHLHFASSWAKVLVHMWFYLCGFDSPQAAPYLFGKLIRII